MRFLVHPPQRLRDWPESLRGYITGFDQSVHPTRVEVDDAVLSCVRNVSESGRFHVAWDVAGFGRPMVATASLPERSDPYLLPLELARGKIVQLRNQVAQWESVGLLTPPEYEASSRTAHTLFAQAVAAQTDLDQCSILADRALSAAFQAAEILTRAYAQQSLNIRLKRYHQIPTLVGCYLPADLNGDWGPAFLDTFNAAAAPISWRQIEPIEGEYHWETSDAQIDWCQEHKLFVRGGPLIDLAPQGLPDWLVRWENDVWNLQSFLCDFVETAIRRYTGRVRMWEVASRGNSGGGLTLPEEHRLGLVAKAIEVARHVDEEAQLFLRIDQPWAEYQARGQHKLSPWQFADALGRAGLGLTGIDLEISIGYTPRGTATRDPLEFSRMIDDWSRLGIPLQLTLAFPYSDNPDPLSTSDLEVGRPNWKSNWTPASQGAWLEEYLPLLVAKPAVTGIFWNQLSDAEPHSLPNAGLRDNSGRWQPGLERIAAFRRAYLR